MKTKKIQGKLVENRILIQNIEKARYLFGNGYYGKPLGIPKPKGTNFESPLILDLIESYYLIQKGELQITLNDKILSLKDLKIICKKQYDKFDSITFVDYLKQVQKRFGKCIVFVDRAKQTSLF